jgi:TonB family protein
MLTEPKAAQPSTVKLEEVSEREPVPSFKLKPLVIALVAVAVVIAILLVIKGTRQPAASNAQTEATRAAQAPAAETPTSQSAPPATNGIVHRVLPQPSAGALRTIQGHIKVRMRLAVDPSGNVSEASFTSPGPSKYFSRLSMEAAKQWQFTPLAGSSREWNVLFEFTRRGVEAFPEPARQ